MVQVKNESKDDDTKITSFQSKWTDEVLKLLNSGSETERSKKISTVGPKTATLTTNCRKTRGEFEKINDLMRQRLGKNHVAK